MVRQVTFLDRKLSNHMSCLAAYGKNSEEISKRCL